MWPFANPNAHVIQAKREQRARSLLTAETILSADQQSVVKATASEIVAHIERGEWTASVVLEAFIAHTAYAQATTNCLTEVMFEQARRLARELDQEFAATKKLRGSLHGVPLLVAVTEEMLFPVEILDVDASIGFTQWANQPATKNADVVQQLLAAGAIPFVKTNVPQTMLAFECSNPVFGRTTNPYNGKYTSGGSSGGEGALIGMDASPLGIGSDIGGSLRIPAAYCGIYSLKPSSERMSGGGARSCKPGFEAIKAVIGPMGRSVQDLELLARLTFGVQGARNAVAPIPYREVVLRPKLRFGYYTSDKYIKASPANKRAVMESVTALQRAGHECVEIELPGRAGEAFDIFGGLASADAYKTLLRNIGSDSKEKSLFLTTLGPRLPSFIRRTAAWVIERIWGDPLFANTLRMSAKKSVHEFYALVDQRDKYTEKFYNQVWDKYDLDGIIAPVQAVPQLPHGGCDKFSVLASATILFNVLDHPVGCIPVTRVDPTRDKITEEWCKESGHGSRIFEAGLYWARKPLYNVEEMKGMPVGIQVVGKRWEDEKVLSMMNVVDRLLGQRGFGPGARDIYLGITK